MRIRSIKPEFCVDEKIGALSREERLHFILLWLAADREGTVEYLPRQLSAMLYPFDEDMTKERFEALTSAVLLKSLCSRFVVNRRDYIHITNFRKHQSLTTWERKESTPVLDQKSLRKYCGSTAEVLRSEERRGEESTEPPNPQGGLSEGEVRFVPLMKVLEESGKISASVRLMDLPTFWKSVEPGFNPGDQGLLEFLRAQLAGHVGKIGSLGDWLPKNVAKYAPQKNNGATDLKRLGPSGENM